MKHFNAEMKVITHSSTVTWISVPLPKCRPKGDGLKPPFLESQAKYKTENSHGHVCFGYVCFFFFPLFRFVLKSM